MPKPAYPAYPAALITAVRTAVRTAMQSADGRHIERANVAGKNYKIDAQFLEKVKSKGIFVLRVEER